MKTSSPQLELRDMPLTALKPAPYNPRTITPKAAKGLRASLKRFGLVQPIVWNRRSKHVVGGHQRLEALRELGKTSAQVVVVDLPEVEEKALNVTLNNPAIEGEFSKQVGEVIASIRSALPKMDFSDLLLGDVPGNKPEIVEDEVPEPPKVAVTQLGDLWTLGRHRLLCGDATKAEDVARVMAGARADVVYTDPPYGVAYNGGAKRREDLAGDEIGTAIYGESLKNLQAAASDRAALYLWYADAHVAAAAAAAAAAGYVITAQIVWVKNNAQFVSSAHYHGKHEPCFYAHRRGKSAAWFGGNTEVTVWEYDRAPRNDYHPTQKPVGLAARAIGNSSEPGGLVLDFFLGSGSTLIAAEQLDRVCFGLEIEPRYCDVIVQRFENLTGQKATR